MRGKLGNAACIVSVAVLMAGDVAAAQSVRSDAPSVPLTVVGSVLGVASGVVVGAIAGGAFTSRDCPTGDPDACLGAAFPGFIWGAGIGATVGAPVGAYLGSGRRGSLPKSLLVSSALFAAEVLVLRSIVEDGRTRHKDAAMGIVISVPVIQVLTSTYLHARAGR